MKLGDRLIVEPESVSSSGEAVARVDGMALFIPYAVTGDRLLVEVTLLKKKYGVAEIREILSLSQYRVEPPCPIFAKCGGCSFQHISYSEQTEIKKRIVTDALLRIGGCEQLPELKFAPISNIFAYRNKVQLVASSVNGKLQFGFYAPRSHKFISIDSCPLQTPLANRISKEATYIASSLGVTGYNELTGKGLLRHMIIRVAKTALVVLVASKKVPILDKFAQLLSEKVEEISGVVININSKKGNTILGDQFLTSIGTDHIFDRVADREFKISAGSFFQVNREGATQLLQIVRDIAKESCGNFLDAYCGSGFFAISLAAQFSKVIGIESFPAAVTDAEQNSALNGISNCEFICGKSEEKLPELISNGFIPDIVLTDPPRKGLEQSVVEKLSSLELPKLIYVSCNPATLARDVKIFISKGYSIERLAAVDMFPQTPHVETVVLMSRVKD